MHRLLMIGFALLVGMASPPEPAKEYNVLMIGNSYTAGTKKHVKAFFDQDPENSVNLTALHPGGKQLLWHRRNPKTLEAVKGGKWDFITLQDQSQTPSFAYLHYAKAYKGPDSFAKWAQARIGKYDQGPDSKFAAISETFWAGGTYLSKYIAEHSKAKIIYYCTWARHTDKDKQNTLSNFPGADNKEKAAVMLRYNIQAYEALQSQFRTLGKVAYVGSAWAESYRQRPDLRLHSRDSSHGSAHGYYLAGAVLYETMTGKSAVGNAYRGGLSDKDAAYLQEIAHKTVTSSKQKRASR